MFFNYLKRNNQVVVDYNNENKTKILNIIKKIKKEVQVHLSDNECMQLFTISRSVSNIKGEFAEVGVYKGGSAKILCETRGEKSLHLFDTFSGLPEKTKEDYQRFNTGNFTSSIEETKSNLKDYNYIYYYEGLVKDTFKQVKDKRFSFVHLDVDLYESTLDCLNLFYENMSLGGIILSHDYSFGVKRAFDEFFKDKPESVIEISDSQCMIIKLENKR